MSSALRRWTKPARHWVLSRGGLAVFALLRVLPMGAARGFASGMGAIARTVMSGRRKQVQRHVNRALGDLPEARRREIARAVFFHASQLFPEAVKGAELTVDDLKQVVSVSGAEEIEKAHERANGGGVILLTPHLGNWEMFARYTTGVLGCDVTAIARARDDSVLEGLITHIRERNGLKVQRRGESLRGIVRSLKEGNDIAALPDQAIRGSEVDVPFFGETVKAHPGIAQLALLAGAPLIPSSFVRVRGDGDDTSQRLWAGWRYEADYAPAIWPTDENGARRSVEELTVAIATEMERLIAKHPDQWMWFHDRWRIRRKKR